MMMNKIGRRLTATAAIVVAALGLGAAHAANAPAAAAEAVPETQNVSVVKIKSDAAPAERDPTQGPDATKPEDLVDGAAYAVYDVTDQYWSEMAKNDINKTNIEDVGTDSSTTDAKYFDVTELTPVATMTTGKNDNANLPTKSTGGRGAVYLFRESVTPKGYNPSADFLLGLPYTAGDGTYPANLYVYPKDAIKNHYFLKFKKVDKYNTATALAGAEFEITRTAGDTTLYAVVDGKTAINGFEPESQKITWVADQNAATKFTSDENGAFGVTGEPESHLAGVFSGLSTDATYGLVETKAPKGYTTAFNYVGGKVQVGTSEDPEADSAENLIGDKPENVLPHTGGRGIIMMVVAGILLVTIGMIAYAKRRNANA